MAMYRLLRVAASDKRVTEAMLRNLVILASFADARGECFPAVGRIARWLGVSRQASQAQLRKTERLGYFVSERTFERTGRESSKVYRFALDIGRYEFCPLTISGRCQVQAHVIGRGCKLQEPAPERNASEVAQNRHLLRDQFELEGDARKKQSAWQAKKRREAAYRIHMRLFEEMGKQNAIEHFTELTEEQFNELLEDELRAMSQ